jgi:hypothetical protein
LAQEAHDASGKLDESTADSRIIEDTDVYITYPERGNSAAMSETNPFLRALTIRLSRSRINRWRLTLDEVRPLRARVGWFHITVGLADDDGRRVGGPVMTAIVSGGGRGVKPWIECRLYPEVRAGGRTIEARAEGIEDELIAIMGAAIPPGGHLMIDYESGGQEQTFNELRLGVPAAATSLGVRMLAAGLVGEFKDWYFSEGGHEGPRKLQANKPPDEKSRRAAIAARIGELRAFLERPLPRERAKAQIVARAHERVAELIRIMAGKPVRSGHKARPARSAVARGRRRRPEPSR